MRNTLILAAIAALAFTSVADAKSCRDAHGKFITCPSAAAAQKSAVTQAKAANKSAKANRDAAKADAKIAVAASKKAHSAAPMSAMTPSQMAAMPAGGAPHCKKGKPCGHSCIAVDKVCHK